MKIIAYLPCILILCLGTTRLHADNNGISSAANFQDYFEKLSHHGQLVVREVEVAPSCYLRSYVYKHDQKGWMLMHGNLGVVNEFLKVELTDEKAANPFLKNDLCDFIIVNMANNDTHPITEETVLGGDGLTPLPFSKPIISKETIHNLGVKLKGYISKDKPTVDGDKWILNMNILTKSGGVERWSISGFAFPLQITSFKTELIEQSGTFFPVLETR
jgi:hypothetical protein